MDYSFSRKAVVLTDDRREELAIKSVLAKDGIEIEKKTLNLSSLDTIRNLIKRTSSLSFIRAELFSFIKEYGYPHLIIMDLRINLGLDKAGDPDRMKLFRTFLISYIILSMGRGFEKIHCDMLVIHSVHDEELVAKLREPVFLLSLLKTGSDQVNEIIEKMKSDNNLFRKLLTVDFFPLEKINDELPGRMSQISIAIQARRNVAEKMANKKLPTLSNDDRKPADVLFNTGSVCFINGEQLPDSVSDLSGGILRVEGRWTSGTTREVSQRVRSMLLNLANERTIGFSDDLTIELGEKCIIDASVAPALAGILIKDLSRFTNIKVKISKYNMPVLSRSEGFSMIKSFVRYLD